MNVEADYFSRNFDTTHESDKIQVNLLTIDEICEKQFELDLSLIDLSDYEIHNGYLIKVDQSGIRRIIVFLW